MDYLGDLDTSQSIYSIIYPLLPTLSSNDENERSAPDLDYDDIPLTPSPGSSPCHSPSRYDGVLPVHGAGRQPHSHDDTNIASQINMLNSNQIQSGKAQNHVIRTLYEDYSQGTHGYRSTVQREYSLSPRGLNSPDLQHHHSSHDHSALRPRLFHDVPMAQPIESAILPTISSAVPMIDITPTLNTDDTPKHLQPPASAQYSDEKPPHKFAFLTPSPPSRSTISPGKKAMLHTNLVFPHTPHAVTNASYDHQSTILPRQHPLLPGTISPNLGAISPLPAKSGLPQIQPLPASPRHLGNSLPPHSQHHQQAETQIGRDIGSTGGGVYQPSPSGTRYRASSRASQPPPSLQSLVLGSAGVSSPPSDETKQHNEDVDAGFEAPRHVASVIVKPDKESIRSDCPNTLGPAPSRALPISQSHHILTSLSDSQPSDTVHVLPHPPETSGETGNVPLFSQADDDDDRNPQVSYITHVYHQFVTSYHSLPCLDTASASGGDGDGDGNDDGTGDDTNHIAHITSHPEKPTLDTNIMTESTVIPVPEHGNGEKASPDHDSRRLSIDHGVHLSTAHANHEQSSESSTFKSGTNAPMHGNGMNGNGMNGNANTFGVVSHMSNNASEYDVDNLSISTEFSLVQLTHQAYKGHHSHRSPEWAHAVDPRQHQQQQHHDITNRHHHGQPLLPSASEPDHTAVDNAGLGDTKEDPYHQPPLQDTTIPREAVAIEQHLPQLFLEPINPIDLPSSMSTPPRSHPAAATGSGLETAATVTSTTHGGAAMGINVPISMGPESSSLNRHHDTTTAALSGSLSTGGAYDQVDSLLLPLFQSGRIPSSFSASHYLVIAMVGLPAHGKSFFGRKLCRYLRWLRYNAALFCSSHYYEYAYKWILSRYEGHPDYDDMNFKRQLHQQARYLGTIQCFYEMSKFMASGGRIILFDATNINTNRRQLLRRFLNQLSISYTLLWVETIITKQQMLLNNILNTRVDRTIFPDRFKDVYSRSSSVLTANDSHNPSDLSGETSMGNQSTERHASTIPESDFDDYDHNHDHSYSHPSESVDVTSQRVRQIYNDIKDYAKHYETLSETELIRSRGDSKADNNECYLKLYNNGEHSECVRINGWLLTKITFYLLNLQTSSKYPLYFSRHGQSKANINNQVGTDLGLSSSGVSYAQELARWVRQQLYLKHQRTIISPDGLAKGEGGHYHSLLFNPNAATPSAQTVSGGSQPQYDLTIYCSTLQRAISTAEYVYNHLVFPESSAQTNSVPDSTTGDGSDETNSSIPSSSDVASKRYRVNVIKWRALTEIDAGEFDGLTYDEIRDRDPVGFHHRSNDKLNYKYPRGESYKDVIDRIETVVYEIERIHHSPVLIIAHQAVIRCMLGYFINVANINDVPHLSVPLNTVIRVYTHTYPTEYESVQLVSKNTSSDSAA